MTVIETQGKGNAEMYELLQRATPQAFLNAAYFMQTTLRQWAGRDICHHACLHVPENSKSRLQQKAVKRKSCQQFWYKPRRGMVQSGEGHFPLKKIIRLQIKALVRGNSKQHKQTKNLI